MTTYVVELKLRVEVRAPHQEDAERVVMEAWLEDYWGEVSVTDVEAETVLVKP